MARDIQAGLLLCRTTVNLVGARAGALVYVDPDEEGVRVYLENGYLVVHPAEPDDAEPQEAAVAAPELHEGESPKETTERLEAVPGGQPAVSE